MDKNNDVINEKEEVPVTYFDTLKSKEVEWLWKPYIAFGKLTVLEGDPGDGKTTFALMLVSQLTSLQGREIKGLCSRKINVIYQSAEDGVEDTIKTKLDRMHADCRRVCFIAKNDLSLEDDSIEKAIIKSKAELLVFDPIQSFIGKEKSMNSVKGVRTTLKKLGTVAAKTKCAILFIGHLTKAEGKKTLYRGLGSIDIPAIARSVLYLQRSQYDKRIRIISQIKNSLDMEGLTVAYETDKENYVHWIGEYTEEFGEPLVKVDGSFTKAGRPETKFTKGRELIKGLMDSGATGAKFILSKCKEQDIGIATITKIKRDLHIVSYKDNNIWTWRYE